VIEAGMLFVAIVLGDDELWEGRSRSSSQSFNSSAITEIYSKSESEECNPRAAAVFKHLGGAFIEWL